MPSPPIVGEPDPNEECTHGCLPDPRRVFLAELGGKVVHGPHDIPGVGRMAVIIDPQGASLSVIAYTMPSG